VPESDDTKYGGMPRGHGSLNNNGGEFQVDEHFTIFGNVTATLDDLPEPGADQFQKTPTASPGNWEWPEGFGKKKLDEYCEIVRSATAGHWDEARRQVFMFGRWVGGGAYNEDEAREALLKAAHQCSAPPDYPTEVVRAFNNGVKEPAGPFIETMPLNDFRAYLPQHQYIYIPTRDLWPMASVNSRFPSVDRKVRASTWLDQNRPVEQMTWAPGEPIGC
jgi:hypothetical protein